MRFSALSAAVVLALTVAGTAAGQSVDNLDRRLGALERKLDSQALTSMVSDLAALREEVGELRGRMDVVERKLEQVEERRRQMYADLDERLRALEEGAAQNPTMDDDASSTANDDQQGAGDAASEANQGSQASGGNPSQDYQRAFETLRDGDYAGAAEQFEAYLQNYPDSQYADNARYWLGESHYVVREFEPAIENFRRVLDDFPDSPKRSDALLKIGFIQYEQGKRDASRETLNEVVQRFPDSSAAELAEQRLQSMGG